MIFFRIYLVFRLTQHIYYKIIKRFEVFHQPYNQPQVIILPPYPTYNNPPSKSDESLKILQKMMSLKNEENKRLMEVLVDLTAKKDTNQKFDHQMSEKSFNNKFQDNLKYNFEKQEVNHQLTAQERIFLALQREELDQLRLISKLPKQLQEIKVDSLTRLAEKRFEIQKEILIQRVKRIENQQIANNFEEKRQISNDRWVSQERKKLLDNQMNEYLQVYTNQLMNNKMESQ